MSVVATSRLGLLTRAARALVTRNCTRGVRHHQCSLHTDEISSTAATTTAAAAVIKSGRDITTKTNPAATPSTLTTATPSDVSAVDSSEAPFPFLGGPGDPSRWSVARSLGLGYQQPAWRVVLLCSTMGAILLWCVFREETEIDDKIEGLPGGQVGPPPVQEAGKGGTAAVVV